jgi:RNA polymerase sigma-70 factor, ECF subfamily
MPPAPTEGDALRQAAISFETTALPWLADVARFAISLTRNRHDADDLVQETYLQAFRHWHTYAPDRDVRRWLFTICRNAFIRSGRKHTIAIAELDDGDLDAMPAVISHAGAVEEGLANLFDEVDVGPAIRKAVGALPEPHRTVLILVDVERLSYQEASEVLSVPVGTVRSRLFRARRAIQTALIEHARDMGLGGKGK